MKRILTIIICLLPFLGLAQAPTPYNTPYTTIGAAQNAAGKVKGGLFIDSTASLPVYSDTLKANKSRTSLYPGSIIRVNDDYYYRSDDTTRWILVATTNSNCGGTRLIDGSITWSGTAYIFNGTVLHYGIICRLFTADTTTLIVSPADPTYPRIDVFYADTSGQVGIIQGIPSPTPVKPSVDALSQIEVSFVYVPAGSVTPPQVATIIYNENIEWATASNISGIDFTYPTNPYDGLVSTLVPLMTAPFDFLSYQNGSVLNINNYQYLKLYLRRNSALGSDPPSELIFTFYNGATQVTSSVFLADGSYGYDGSVIGSYQLIVIPISAFTLADSLFDKLYITNTFGALSSFQLDKIYILGNVPPPPVISNAWVRSGNAATNPATDYVGTSDSTQLNIGRNGNFDLIIPDDGINLTADTSKHILVRDPVTNKMYWIYQPSIYALGCLKIYDSTSTGITRKYIRDTCSGGGGGSGWNLTGNSVTTSDFLGTTNNEDLVFKRNNILVGRVSSLEENTFFGEYAGWQLPGVGNSLYGAISGYSLISGSNYNSLFGGVVGQNITTGDNNIAMGYSAADNLITGSSNTLLGYRADVSTSSTDSSIALGFRANAGTRQFAISPYITQLKSQITGYNTVGNVLTITSSGIAEFQTPTGGSSPWTQGAGGLYPTIITDNVGIGTIPTAGDDNGLLQINKTGGTAGFFTGADIRVTGTSGIEVDNNLFATSTGASARGLHAIGQGTSSAIFGIEAEGIASTSGSAYGISAVASANTGEAIGGYFAATATDSTKAYGVYSAAGNNYFSDSVGIGTLTPTESLDIVGNIQLTGSINAMGNGNNVLGNGVGTYLKVSGSDSDDKIFYNSATIHDFETGTVSMRAYGVGYATFDASGNITSTATIPNAGLTNSSTTINGTSIALGASGTVTAAAGTLTGTTLASGVTASSLTSFGASIALGTPASGVGTNLTGIPLTSAVTGVLPIANGGTSQSSYATGDLIYASATNVLSKRTIGAQGEYFTVNASGVPIWQALSLNTFNVGGNSGIFIANMRSATTTVGTGTNAPVASAVFESASTTKGILFPRMTTTQKNAISSPAEGLVVYDLTLHKLCVYTGSAWETVTSL